MLRCVFAGCLALSQAHAAVATLDGDRIPGPVVVDPAAGTAVSGERSLRLADLDRVDLPLDLARVEGSGVWLADGGWVPGTVTAATMADQIVVTGGWGEFTFPLAAVRAWGAPPEEGAKDDAVVLEGGIIRGRIEGLRQGAVVIRSALKPDPIPLEKIKSLRLGGAVRPSKGLQLTVQPDPIRPPLPVARRGDGWRPALAVDGTLRAGDGLSARVEGPRRAYLSELAPSLVEDLGAFGVVWPWQRDRDLDGQPIRLGQRLHPRGLTVHSAAHLQWSLKGQFSRLRGLLGIADAVAPEGDCIAVLTGDGRELLRHRARGGQDPLALDLDLTGIQLLDLWVELGERHDIGDHLVLADATLVRAKR